MFEKVLIHDEASTEVHLVGGNFLTADKTLCDERLHSICSVHIVNDKIPVTCNKCLTTWADTVLAHKKERVARIISTRSTS